MSASATASQLLTPEQLAERWQLKKSQVYRLTREGVIKSPPLGKYYRYPLPAVEAFEADGVWPDSSLSKSPTTKGGGRQ